MNSTKPKRQKLFDQWAKTYDQDLGDVDRFPFIGYGDVLNQMIETAAIQSHHTVLDLGIGTGNLSKRLPILDQQIWGVDFSQSMLERAQIVLPNAHLIRADLSGHDWMIEIQQPFDRILSAYTFHEFSDEEKIGLILNLAERCLHKGGCFVIGDISFEDRAHFTWANRQYADLWDEEEDYWCAEPLTDLLGKAGFCVKYDQVSPCAGVYRIQIPDEQNLEIEDNRSY